MKHLLLITLMVGSLSFFSSKVFAHEGFPNAQSLDAAQDAIKDAQSLLAQFSDASAVEIVATLNNHAPRFDGQDLDVYLNDMAQGKSDKYNAFLGQLLGAALTTDEAALIAMQHLDILASAEFQDSIEALAQATKTELQILSDAEVYAVALAAKGTVGEELDSAIRGYYVLQKGIANGAIKNGEFVTQAAAAQSTVAQTTPANPRIVPIPVRYIEVGCREWYWPWWNVPDDDQRATYLCDEGQTGNVIIACEQAACRRCGDRNKCEACCNYHGGGNPSPGTNCRQWCRERSN